MMKDHERQKERKEGRPRRNEKGRHSTGTHICVRADWLPAT